MMSNACRLCGEKFTREPLLCLDRMPAGAQFLPSSGTLSRDRGVSLKLFQCRSCGLAQLANPPVEYYREVIRASAFSPEMGKFRKKQLFSFVYSNKLKGRKILELGCGKGEYLRLLHGSGARAFGMEFSAGSVSACRLAGLRVFKGFVSSQDAKIPCAPFDAFFSFNFLEHLPSPLEFLRGIKANLAPGAVGIIEVPNSERILVHRMISEIVADHLLYFTRDTLELLLRLAGFSVLDSREVWHGNNISALVRAPEPLGHKDFSGQAQRLRAELCGYLGRFKRVAVWGASHQALAMLALAGKSADRVKYVVDSAPFKQGRYTPVTHIPIRPPEALRAFPVDAVLIMAAGYSGEVAARLRAEFPGNIRMAVLKGEKVRVIPRSQIA